MFEKFSRSWELAKASAAVLRSDKEMLLFPVMSGLAAMVLMASFVLPIFALRLFENGNACWARSWPSCSISAATRSRSSSTRRWSARR
jgi:hypothetical protein